MSERTGRPNARHRRRRRRANADRTPAKRLSFKTIFADEFCEIRANRRALKKADRVLLSFTGGGHAMGGMRVQTLEFVGTASRQGAPIFITDLTRSWGNRLDFPRIADRLAPYLEGKEVVSLGNSMGGFLSILATSYLPIKTAIAMSPQFSVHPQIVPQERRWAKYRRTIDCFRYDSLEGHFQTGTKYYAFFGAARTEKVHYTKFPVCDNVAVMVFPGQGHSLAQWLHGQGQMDTIISACISGTFSLPMIRDAAGPDAYQIGTQHRPWMMRSLWARLSPLVRSPLGQR